MKNFNVFEIQQSMQTPNRLSQKLKNNIKAGFVFFKTVYFT